MRKGERFNRDSFPSDTEEGAERDSFAEVFSRWLPVATISMALLVLCLWLWLWVSLRERRLKDEATWRAMEPVQKLASTGEGAANVHEVGQDASHLVNVSDEVDKREEVSYRVVKGLLSEANGVLKYEVIFQEVEGRLNYRVFLFPYDAEVSQSFAEGLGSLFLVFVDEQGKRVAPTSGRLSVPLSDFAPFELGGVSTGWLLKEVLPLEEGEVDVAGVRVSAYFDASLHKRLLELVN